jgi:branched-subunit amino acid aminotransferase/4-amino-4-deoxychorismate lyase
MSTATILRWHDGRLETVAHDDPAPEGDTTGASPGAAPDAAQLVVADSWLVDDGRARALDVHRDRFTSSVVEALAARGVGPADSPDVDAFWAAAIARLPRTDRWFPRVELVSAGVTDPTRASSTELRLRLRAAPPAAASVVLATASHDPRTRPLVKGPDLAALGRVRDEARSRGADEAVVLSGDGHVVDGAWSSVVWWRGDALCLPADDLPRLPGVTVRTLATLAAVMGVDVLHEHARPDELDGFELWTTSALHGIRIATDWVDGPSPAEEPGRLALWRSRLEALRRPLPSA